MKKYYLDVSMFFLAFSLLMEDEKNSGKKSNLLYTKILGKELSYEQFEKLFKEFRKNLQTKAIRFYDTYSWFEIHEDAIFPGLVVVSDQPKFIATIFAGTPEVENRFSSVGVPIQPKFVVTDNALIVKLRNFQADDFCGFYDFYAKEFCWPYGKWLITLSKIRKSKYYSSKFMNAIRLPLQSFDG